MLIDWSRLPAATGLRPGMARKTVCGDKMSAALMSSSADAMFDGRLHAHENEQMLVVVSGRIHLQIEEERFEAGPGDLVFFQAGQRHAAVGVGPDGAVYYEMFAPARTDQLPGWVAASALRY